MEAENPRSDWGAHEWAHLAEGLRKVWMDRRMKSGYSEFAEGLHGELRGLDFIIG